MNMNFDIEWPASATALGRALQKKRGKWPVIAGLPLTLAVVACVVFQVYKGKTASWPVAFLALPLLASVTLCLYYAVVYNQIRRRLDSRKAMDDDRLQAAIQNTLVSRASFDIRSGLMAILGYCDLPLEDKSRVQDRFDSIRRQTRDIVAAVDGFLETADTSNPEVLSQTPATSPVVPQGSLRVLLAEDDPHLQEVIKFYLQSCGAQVTIVADGQLAYEQAMLSCDHGRPFDLILMDVQMPKFDGRDATIRLRDAGYAHPIVALTANATDQEQRRCMAAGCNGFLAKPVDREDLLRTMRQFVLTDVSVRSGGDQLPDPIFDAQIAALRESFRGEIPARIAEIANAVFAKDLPKVAELSHRLKGTAGCYGFASLSDSSDALQAAAARPEADETIQKCLRTLSEQSRQFITAQAA